MILSDIIVFILSCKSDVIFSLVLDFCNFSIHFPFVVEEGQDRRDTYLKLHVLV